MRRERVAIKAGQLIPDILTTYIHSINDAGNLKHYTFFMPSEMRVALRTLKLREGIPESTAIRKAIAAYLKRYGFTVSEWEKGAKRKTRRK